ncbi:MAG: hypothetical protein LLG01_08165 [Planctomycetaceae bacterium]|nr:hypothetical protein [Planctomycetaceae bacterium]
MKALDHILVAKWARLGVMFNVPPWRQTPDLEGLLIETVSQIPDNPRLFVMTATWLGRYSPLVARHRLAVMAAELPDPASAVLGLLLDTAAEITPAASMEMVRARCRPAPAPMPLFTADRTTPALRAPARSAASTISKRWNVWAEPVDSKADALRPADWVMQHNCSMKVRAVFRGTLRASVLACLEHHVPAGASEAELARLCGVTRKALHEALDHLELCDMIRRSRFGRSYRVSLSHPGLRIAG